MRIETSAPVSNVKSTLLPLTRSVCLMTIILSIVTTCCYLPTSRAYQNSYYRCCSEHCRTCRHDYVYHDDYFYQSVPRVDLRVIASLSRIVALYLWAFPEPTAHFIALITSTLSLGQRGQVYPALGSGKGKLPQPVAPLHSLWRLHSWGKCLCTTGLSTLRNAKNNCSIPPSIALDLW